MIEWRAFWKFVLYTLGLLVFALFIAGSFFCGGEMERNANIVAGPQTSYSYAVGQELDNWLKSNGQSSTLTIEEDTLSAIAAIQYINDEFGMGSADPDSINVGFVAQRVNADEYDDVVSLGTIASLPLLIFARADLGENLSMRDLANKQVSIGVPGSDVNQLMLEIFNTTGYSATVDVRNDPSGMGVEQLLAGEVDAVALLTSLGAPVVRELAANPDLTIVNLDRSSALAACATAYSRGARLADGAVVCIETAGVQGTDALALHPFRPALAAAGEDGVLRVYSSLSSSSSSSGSSTSGWGAGGGAPSSSAEHADPAAARLVNAFALDGSDTSASAGGSGGRSSNSRVFRGKCCG